MSNLLDRLLGHDDKKEEESQFPTHEETQDRHVDDDPVIDRVGEHGTTPSTEGYVHVDNADENFSNDSNNVAETTPAEPFADRESLVNTDLNDSYESTSSQQINDVQSSDTDLGANKEEPYTDLGTSTDRFAGSDRERF